MVVMDYLDGDHYISFDDDSHVSEELYESMKRILEKLHQAGVHEDVRTVNTMVKNINGDPSKFMLLDFDWAGPPSAPYARSSPHPTRSRLLRALAPLRHLVTRALPLFRLSFSNTAGRCWAVPPADEGVIKSHSLFSVLCSTLRHPGPYSDLVVGARRARAVGCYVRVGRLCYLTQARCVNQNNQKKKRRKT